MAGDHMRATRWLVAATWACWKLGLTVDWILYWYGRLTGRICVHCQPTSAPALEFSSWSYRALIEDKFAFWGKRTLVQDALDRAGVPPFPADADASDFLQG